MWKRSIRPPDDITPNPNDPAAVPPSTVGPDQLVHPGDPNGVVIADDEPPAWLPPRIIPSAWSGWPADWWPPYWNSTRMNELVDMAWMCLDMNSRLLSTMPPYLVDARTSLNADWLNNPNSDLYTSWEEFAKQLFWDYYLGEAFVVVDSRYATGWPARFHVVPPWSVNVEMDGGRRYYSIGNLDVTDDMLHIRYQSSVSDAHGHGPLEVGATRMVAARTLMEYWMRLTAGGGIPAGVLNHPETQSAEQSALLQLQWLEARQLRPGAPAVLSGGITWEPTQIDPEKMTLIQLQEGTERRIAYLLGVPSSLVGLGSGGDSMTYSNVMMYFLQHWRVGLRPSAQTVMSGLSQWLLPRGVRVELNRDAYIEPEPLVRAQVAQILHSIQDVDPVTGATRTALTIDEIRGTERLDNSTPTDVSAGVLK
jgi:HK97 family phage portal protein